jgi:hypothetical protein
MADIFISYRRADSEQWASHLCTTLKAVFGDDRVFLDERGGLEAGDDYPAKLDAEVRSCKLFLAVIGPRWLQITDTASGARRLDDPADWVRRETRNALNTRKILVPVLVGEAAMPRRDSLPADLAALSDREAIELKDGQYWDFGVAQIVKAARRRGVWPVSWRRAAGVAGLSAVLVAAVAGWVLLGGGRATVPDLGGKPLAEARSMLDRARLQAGDEQRESVEGAPPGVVVRQSPSAGTSVAIRSRVDLTVSAGPPAKPASLQFSVLDPAPEGDVQLALEKGNGDIEGVEWLGAEETAAFAVTANTKYRLTVSGARIRNQMFDQPLFGRAGEPQFYGLELAASGSQSSHRLIGPARDRSALATPGGSTVQVASTDQVEARLPPPPTGRETPWPVSGAAASLPVRPDLLRRVALLVCGFETGSVVLDNCWFALSGNYAGEGLSLGFLQWNLRQKNLQPLLRTMNARHPVEMRDALGAQNHAALMAVLAEPDNVARQIEWADSIQDPKRHTVREPWRSAFRKLASLPAFQGIMIEATLPLFDRAVRLANDYGFRSERGLALMFDTVVNAGGVSARAGSAYREALQAKEKQLGRLPEEVDRMVLLAESRAAATGAGFRRYVLGRALTVAKGQGTVGGIKYDLEKLRITLADFARGG